MKHFVAYLLLLTLPAVGLAQAPVPFTIKGTIGTLSAPATVYLLREGRFDDQAVLDHGRFELRGTMRSPQPSMLVLARSGRLREAGAPERLFFFLETGPIIITSPDSLSHVQVAGSPLTQEYVRLQESLRPLNEHQYQLLVQRQALPAQGDPAAERRVTAQLAAITAQLNQQLIAYIRAHPASFVSLDALRQVGGSVPDYAVVAPLYYSLAAPVRQSLAGQDYGGLLQAIRTAADHAPAGDTTAIPHAVEQYQLAQQQVQDQARNQHLRATIQAQPAAAASLVALQELGGPNPDYAQLAPLFASLAPALQASPAGQAYAQRLAAMKTVSRGQPAPVFTQPTPEGRAVSLADYRGKYVLVDFWASWCGPCRAENPRLVAAYQAYHAKGFDILSVSLDEARSRAQWVAAIQADGLPWTHVSDLQGFASPTAKQYQVQAIPQNFLVDPTGTIVATNLRGEQLQATLAQLLK